MEENKKDVQVKISEGAVKGAFLMGCLSELIPAEKYCREENK